MRLGKIVGFAVFLSLLVTKSWGIYSGKVLDLNTRQPVKGALVEIKGKNISAITDEYGEFRLRYGSDSLSDDEIKILGQSIYWNIPVSGELKIYNIAGQIISKINLTVGEGNASIGYLEKGIYIFRAELLNQKIFITKFLYTQSALASSVMQITNSGIENFNFSSASDTLIFSKNGFYTQSYPLNEKYNEYDLLKIHNDQTIIYFNKLIRSEAFKLLQGEPLSPVYSEIQSVKVVYSISDDKIYYINSELFFLHYDFAHEVLDYSKGHATFNTEQYTNNPNRLYYLATINHYTSSDIYTLDFWAGDELDCSQIETVYTKVVATTYIGDKLKFYANNQKWTDCTSIPQVTSDELYAGQNFQPLNPGEAFGYLKKYTLDDLKTQYIGHHDVVLLNGIPNDITAVSGIITTEFQTPLSHINVLSHNRGTPNMALRDGWTNPQIISLENKLVYLKVTLDTFVIREASLNEAQAFWVKKEPAEVTKLRHDTLTKGLIDLTATTVESDTLIGGKAANFSELLKIRIDGNFPLPLPEGAFAIPFYYYWNHIHQNSLDVYIRQMLNDTKFKSDFQYRKTKLLELQDLIKNSPIDPVLLDIVNTQLSDGNGFTNFRFRSSTNSEDIKGFNGAGLYDSYSGILGDDDKTIEKAIKKVWASVWNIGAFEEREYFKIDQQSVSMAILVHRSFPGEEANGVVITHNLYNEFNPGFVINVQKGEISITNPEGGYIPDQIIWYQFGSTIEYISHSSVPGMEGKTVLSDDEVQQLAKYCMAIHNHYCMLNQECLPVDIEFKVDLVDGKRKIYIKQARLY